MFLSTYNTQEFRHDFYPGEQVQITLDDPNIGKLHGVVREKVRFPEKFDEYGTVAHRAYSRYFVTLTDNPDQEALVDDEHITRDRKTFSKQMLRSYLKNSLHRESWSGAPWQVKDHLASQYRIDIEIPPHLRHDAQIIQRKIKIPVKIEHHELKPLNFEAPASSNKVLPELKPKGPKAKQTAQETDRIKQERVAEYQRALAGNPNLIQFPRNGSRNSDSQVLQFINQAPLNPVIAPKEVLPPPKLASPPPPPPPPIKYPREDLDNPVSRNVRPTLKSLTEDSAAEIHMESVGVLLETWDTLNVYCQVFFLDSFTFDDYVDALQFSSEDYQCELLVEIHCAILKQLVNDEKDKNGQVQISLPASQDSDNEEGSDKSKTRTPTPEPEIKRTTRSSLAKSEAAEARAQAALDAKVHLGAEVDQCVRGYNWKARLRKRDFGNGRWVVIIVGLLNLYSTKPQFQATCEALLAKLAPTNMLPAEDTSISQYAILDINDRVKILQFLCTLSIETKAIREEMERSASDMTEYRKEKIEWQRKRKEHLAELKALDEERRVLQPEANSPVREIQEIVEEIEDAEMKDAGDETEEVVMDSEDEDPIPQRSLRRAKDREAERKRKLEQERKRKEDAKAEKAKKPSKEVRQLGKVMKKIEEAKTSIKDCEHEISVCDEDLRQSDVPRTRVLGKDRFWNRYYWFERNAMPYGGLPDSSTAHAEYANGRLWVQGPDPMERAGFIDLSDHENAMYAQTHGCTMPERKQKEEGETSLRDAFEWGFYDSPDDLDMLIGWLSEKGTREFRLRKELQAQRQQISIRMEKRQEYLNRDQEENESTEPVARISTRKKTYVDLSGHRFMQWRNMMAMSKIGQIHSEPPRPQTRPPKVQKVQRKGVARPMGKKIVVEDEPRKTRGTLNKQGKPLTRQGSRYDF